MSFLGRLHELLKFPSLRYSVYFSLLKGLFQYDHAEEILNKIMPYIKDGKISGDYLEFGVWIGNSFVPAYHLAQRHHVKNMRFIAFDSFEGLPEKRGIDKEYVYEKGHFDCGLNQFKNILKRRKVDLKKVKFVKGWFDKTLTKKTKEQLKLKKAAVIWVDCDLYSSTVPVMNFITDLIQDGTIIVFDDWFCFKGNPNKGEQKAFHEWLKKNKQFSATEFHKMGWGGNSFIIHKKK